MDSTEFIQEQARRCNHCVHYYITHDVNFPYGCRALAFKSRHQPARDVVAASGEACLYFQPKKPA